MQCTPIYFEVTHSLPVILDDEYRQTDPLDATNYFNLVHLLTKEDKNIMNGKK